MVVDTLVLCPVFNPDLCLISSASKCVWVAGIMPLFKNVSLQLHLVGGCGIFLMLGEGTGFGLMPDLCLMVLSIYYHLKGFSACSACSTLEKGGSVLFSVVMHNI